MPFKTKRQKIAARQRRFTFSEGKISLTEKNARQTLPVEAKMQKMSSTGSSVQTGDLQYIKKDVLKTFVIATLIVTFQVLIYLRIG